MTDTTSRVGISGFVQVTCVHNREKRTVTDLKFDPAKHKAHMCPCCENLFLREDDVPHYCPQCTGRPVYPLGGPLPEPTGAL